MPESNLRTPEDYDPVRDGTHGFSFDDVSYPCFPLGSTWNGFDNVSISTQTRDLIVADWKALPGFDPDTLTDFVDQPVESDGRVCLGWGYATQLDEDPAAPVSIASRG